MNTVNDIKNIIAEYSKKFRDISNDYNQDNALKTMKETISAFNSILNFEHVENTRIQRTRNTFNEELIFFIEQMCSDVLRLPNLEENINLVTSQREILIDKSDSGNGSGSGESTIVFNKVDEYVQKDMITIKGDTQVGKEKFTVMTAILHMFKGIIPVIITRNITGDATKLERGINNYFKLLENHMRENNKDIPFKLSCIRPHKLKPGIKTVPLVVCLGNSTQLKYIYDFIKETRKRVLLLIDEIDHVDYGDSDTSRMIADIDSISYQKIGISATVMDVICSEKSLKSINILILTKPEDYRGLSDINVKILEFETRGINNIVKNYKEILDSDLNFEPFIEKFSESNPEYVLLLDKYIPNICLIKNTRININQDIIFDNIIKKYSTKLVTIVYNGNGIKMYFDKMESCKINNKNIQPKQYVDIDITCVIQYLKDNGDVEKFPRILILSGDYASRCTSFVSRDYEWHLTDMYYNPATSTPISELVQNVGRLTGRNKNKAHLYLHCTQKVARALFHGYHFCNEIIERARENPKIQEDGNELQFIESVKAVKMNKNKFPIGRKLCSKSGIGKHDFNLVKTEDGGKSIDEYKFKVLVEELVVQRENLIKTETKIDGEVDGVKINNLQRWIKPDCKLLVSKMLKFLYTENKDLTFDKFKEGIDYRGNDKQLSNNINGGRGVKSQYGKLWNFSNATNIISINKNIYTYIQIYFPEWDT